MSRQTLSYPIILAGLVALLAGGCGSPADSYRRATRPAGPVRDLAPVTRRSGCRVHGALPDRACTPGAVYANADRATICRHGYARRERKAHGPTFEQRTAIYRAYAITQRFTGASGEVDHSVPFALGGRAPRRTSGPKRRRCATAKTPWKRSYLGLSVAGGWRWVMPST